MARTPILAAGGIVLQRGDPPLIAVVRLRKRDEWVLPKGKLNDGETALAAAEREVREETGHVVSVHEFLGTLAYSAGGRSKVVHYWRMEARRAPTLPLMSDVRAVAWLPLDQAVVRLTRDYEGAFLAQVGPLALQAAEVATPMVPPARKTPVKRNVASKPVLREPAAAPPRPEQAPAGSLPATPAAAEPAVAGDDIDAMALAGPAPADVREPDAAGPSHAPEPPPADQPLTGDRERPNRLRQAWIWLRMRV